MDRDDPQLAALRQALAAATRRAEQAEQALEAIYSGAADAIIVPAGDSAHVFIRDGADRSYREIVELMAQGVAVCDLEGRVIRVNQALADLLEQPSDRLVGRPLAELVAPESAGDLEALIDLARSGRDRSEQGVLRLNRPGRDGLPAYVGVSRLVLDGLDVLLATLTDMSRQQRDDELLASERLARSIIDQAVDAIVVCDTTGHVVRASREAHRLCGGNPLRRRFDEAFPLCQAAPGDVEAPPHDEPAAEPIGGPPLPLQELLGEAPIRNLEVTLRCRDVTAVLLLNSGPIRDEAGRHLATIVTLTDVTPLKQAEARLLEADRRKDEFLAMLAHELRNPLAAMAYGVALLRESSAPPAAPAAPGRQGEDADEEPVLPILERQVAHMRRLVDDLLDVARVERGRIVLRPRPVDLAELAEHVLGVVRPAIAERDHRLERSIGPGPLWVLADPTRLEQILVNLLGNAAKYTPPGGRIALEARPDPDDERRVLLAVRDDGVGLAPEMRERVFDLFAQAERSLDRQQGGLGIGLTLVRRLVELHGGTIEAASDGPGLGSTFTVRLPRAEPPAPAEPDGPARDAAPGRGRHVLLIDDNRDMARVLRRLLEAEGHRVDVAHDGPSGLEAARRLRPEVVVLDLGLPGLDGFELARRLRRVPGLADRRLIAVSGYGGARVRERALAAGIDHHLTKPVDPADLDRLIRVAPDPHPPPAAAPAPPATPAPPAAPAPSYKILLVEDQRALAIVARKVLERIGHVVELAADGPTALELARRFRPDVVLCDLQLDGPMDGLDVARALRQDPELAGTPLIAVTASDGESIRQRSLASGFDLHLLKPVDYTEVPRFLEQAGRP